jgi:hypothetical protein
LPSVLWYELANPQVSTTVNNHPDLFLIVTPINVDHFEQLLKTHPNQPFISSVCKGLREGFWPWVDTHQDEYPTPVDESIGMPNNLDEANFLRSQRDIEIEKSCFSHTFRTDLLPGMHSSPLHAVPKPHSTDFRMVINQSAGKYSPNSMIDKNHLLPYPMDNLTHLGTWLIDLHQHKQRSDNIIILKSNIAEAYRLMPMHSFWQVKQVVTIDSLRHIDWCNCFGGRGSGGIFVSFMALVLWIAVHIYLIQRLSEYVDDEFGCDNEWPLVWYAPYNDHLSPNQVSLLRL